MPKRHYFYPWLSQSFMRWAKNLQRVDQSHTMLLPKMRNSWICPVLAVEKLLASQSYVRNDLLIKVDHKVLSESHLRKRLALVLRSLGMPQEGYTFHALRRSGASLAFNENVSFDSIRSQGAWSSDAIWSYLHANSHKVQEVPTMFQRTELTSSLLGAYM